jgi:preprotein translocase subunit SecE
MATSKPAIVKSEEKPTVKRQEPGAAANAMGRVTETWQNFTHFLGDVRAETRKIVTPSRKEVEATTTVVIATVFIFGLFFYVVDKILGFGLDRLLKSLSGIH